MARSEASHTEIGESHYLPSLLGRHLEEQRAIHQRMTALEAFWYSASPLRFILRSLCPQHSHSYC
ncbi:MAG: hypothetical protein ACK56F_07160, partial [bacterium]